MAICGVFQIYFSWPVAVVVTQMGIDDPSLKSSPIVVVWKRLKATFLRESALIWSRHYEASLRRRPMLHTGLVWHDPHIVEFVDNVWR